MEKLFLMLYVKKPNILLLNFFVLLSLSGFTQTNNDVSQNLPKWQLRGYVKDLRLLNQTRGLSALQDNFIHNRLNFKYFPTKNVTFSLEVRNRAFYGETVKLDKTYASRIHIDNGIFNTSILWVNHSGLILHSIIDRANVNYSFNNWDITLGRQRVNWGINTIFNPNDLFNTYNFVDFDYEERPGTDAIRIQRYVSAMSSAEIVLKLDTGKNNQVFAGRYTFNKWNYDFQTLGGLYYNDIALGIGWAGNIKMAGFKGEATYFHPTNKVGTSVLVWSTAIEYSFLNGLFISGGFLHNTGGIKNINNLTNQPFLSQNLNAKNLMPTRYNWLLQTSKAFSPILSASIAGVFAHEFNVCFLMPSLTASVANNWEFMLLGQLYGAPQNNHYNLLGSTLFIRTKYSF